MIMCPRHGGQSGPHVSPDLAADILARRPTSSTRRVTYYFDGDPVWDCIMSEKYVAENAVTEFGNISLPDDYPDWFLKLGPICGRCAEEMLGDYTQLSWA